MIATERSTSAVTSKSLYNPLLVLGPSTKAGTGQFQYGPQIEERMRIILEIRNRILENIFYIKLTHYSTADCLAVLSFKHPSPSSRDHGLTEYSLARNIPWRDFSI